MQPDPPRASFSADDIAATTARAVAGQFVIEREIGRGGMGVVFLARDLKLDRPVALKVLPRALADDATVRERFLREARTAARLAHPNIVRVYRADEIDGVAFFTMEFVEGESLGERLQARGPLPAADAVRMLRDVAWALAYAHARGVVHRDVKPENILVERGTGRAVVTDFGIARHFDSLAADAGRLTQDGHILGTLHYISPEQVNGNDVDGRSDLYSLGVVGYQTLSGQLPFADVRGAAVLVAHATRDPAPLSSVAPRVPTMLAAVIDRCLRKRPEDRFATGEALADALEQSLVHASAAERDGPSAPSAGLPQRISEAQAAAIWKRAAQLQSEALHRLESRRDLLPAADASSSASDTGPTAADGTSGGYRLVDVTSAAEEAGISRQYVAMALAEQPRGSQLVSIDAQMGVSERQATRFLGTDQRSLAVSHVVPASPSRTLRALGVVLQREPYDLALREVVGGHPLDGGVIVFDIADLVRSNLYWMGAHGLVLRQLQVTLRAIPGDANRTEVTMTGDLRQGVRRNVRTSQGFAAAAGIVGGWAGGAAGVAAMLMSNVPVGFLVAAPLAAGAALVGGASVAWYRWLYPATIEKSRKEMLRALQAVSATFQSEEIFGTAADDALNRLPRSPNS